MRIPSMAVVTLLAVSACTTVPEQIAGDFPDLVPGGVDQAALGSKVRWGGVILKTHHRDGETCFEILSRDLDRYMRPEREDYTNGRYVACKDGFQDPVVFSKGREVTTTGTIRNLRVRKIDDFSFPFPVVEVDTLVLWEKRRHVTVYQGMYPPVYYRYPWSWGYYPMHHRVYAEPYETIPEPSIVDSDGAAPEGNRP